MKVLHIISSLETGGAQKLLSDLIPYQIKAGVETEVLVYREISSKYENELQSKGIKIHYLNIDNLKSINVIKGIRRYIKNYDIIHSHLFPTLYQVALANIGIGKRLVYTEHSTYNRRRDKSYLRRLEQFIYRRYTRIIAISNETKDALVRWLGDSFERRISVIPNGISLDVYLSSERDDKRIITPKSVLMVSRFTEAKDQATVVKAIKYINDLNLKFYFAGSGQTLKTVKQLTDSLNVTDRCQFLGDRNDVPQLINESYIGIQSSNWEGFGLTAVEFMAAGKPIVASDVDGLRQVVENAGITFVRGNEKDLALKINQLMENPVYYNEVSERCRTKAIKYDIKNTANLYNLLYTDILSSTV